MRIELQQWNEAVRLFRENKPRDNFAYWWNTLKACDAHGFVSPFAVARGK